MKLFVVMPAYNESDSVINCILLTKQILKEKNWDFHIQVIDDGSSDNTYSLVEKITDEYISIEKLPKNMGKGYAVKTGVLNSKDSSIVAYMDSDLDISPSYLNLYAEFIQNNIADMVLGSKLHPLSKVNYPNTRKYLSRVFYFFVKFILGATVSDSQVGLKVMNGEMARTVFQNLKTNGFAFDLEVIQKFQKSGARVLEQPVEINHSWDSRIGIKNSLQALWQVIKLRNRI